MTKRYHSKTGKEFTRWSDRGFAGNFEAGWRGKLGHDRHGLWGDPMLVMEKGPRQFRLKKGSPAIDRAQRIPGVNDACKGAGPDMGAFEFGVAERSTRGAAGREKGKK